MISASAATRHTPSTDSFDIACATTAAHQNSLHWSVHLLRQHPEKLGAILIAFGLIIACSFCVFHNVIVGLVGCIVAAGSIKEYLLPLSFTLSETDVVVKCGPMTWLEMPWEQVQAVYRTPAGLKLSPYANPRTSRLELLRGITLRFPRERAAEIEAFVASARARNAEAKD